MEKRVQVVRQTDCSDSVNAGLRWGGKFSTEADEFTLARKAAKSLKVPVPQTDTGRRGENPKTNERTIVKELGKITS